MTFYSGRIAEWREILSLTGTVKTSRGRSSCPRYLGRVLRLKSYALRRYAEALEARLLAKWSCIHSFEGAWNANTGNGYYGGLQMDWSFMSSHGGDYLARWGPAHNWPVLAQLIVAERAYQSGRGFGPWPNTRRMCGV